VNLLEPADRYDVIVAGAGPGGSVAARECARRGLRTLLLERRREIGTPLACAEAVRAAGFDRLTRVDPAWIASPIDGGRLFTPDGSTVVFDRPGAGMVLERTVFERHLAGEAAAAGAFVLVDTPVLDLQWEPEGAGKGQRVSGILARVRGRSRPIAAAVTIAADGVESHVARRAGITATLPRDQFLACAQFLLTGPAESWNVRPGFADFLVGNRVAPGGYGWRFPKGGERWNVGIAVTPADAQGVSPTESLRRLVARDHPGARVLGYVSGAIPAPAAPGPFAAPGLLLVGDAARLTEPLSGAGIAIAMESGVFAAEAAAEAVGRADPSLRVLRAYEERWRAERGREVAFYARARAFFRKLTDPDLARVGRALARVVGEREPGESSGAFDLGKSLVTADPRLLLLGRHLLAA
jgi:digeranylgeranylglycerophospholipid reductase